MPFSRLAADIRLLLKLARGQPRAGSHAERLSAFYGPQAGHHDASHARLPHGREAMLAALDVRSGMRAVELDCATGHNLDTLATMLPIKILARVQLVDLCPLLLEVARRHAVGRSNVERPRPVAGARVKRQTASICPAHWP